MFRCFILVVMGMFTATAATAREPALQQVALKTAEHPYQVLSPWAEVDPIPLKGISPRLDSLAGKKIGVFANYKRAAVPIAESVQKKLKAMYPGAEISFYHSDQWNVDEAETENREKFTQWAEGVDAAVLDVGD